MKFKKGKEVHKLPAKILVVDDEESMCNFMEIMLSKEGYAVDTASSGPEGLEKVHQVPYDLIIADLNMPQMTGIELLKEVRTVRENQELIVMTAFASVDTAIEAMKQGAADYITKPFKVDEIKLVIDKCLSRQHLLQENSELRKKLLREHSFDLFIGTSKVSEDLKDLCRQIAGSDSTVLIRGESGTGKDLIARAIHQHSVRKNGPFVAVNCGALPENLLESELFGHIKGSFTGAIRDKEGLFQAAEGGTLFLDEIGNTSISIQVKLLRVLEDKMVTPVGGTTPAEVDVRLIAATNADLEADVKQGGFRTDLFYRLNVIPINIPPLRERQEDVPILVEHFLDQLASKPGGERHKLTSEAMRVLCKYHWPGNVRELENTIERAVLLGSSDTIDVKDLPDNLSSPKPTSLVQAADPEVPTLESIEKAYIHYVLTQSDGKKSAAAKVLGIDSSTLYRKLERYRLTDLLPKRKDKDCEEAD